MKCLQWFLCGIMLANLAGCTYLTNIPHPNFAFMHRRDTAYLKSHTTPRLRMPAGLSDRKVSNQFDVPAVTRLGNVPASTVPPYGLKSGQLPVSQVQVKKDISGYPGVLIRHRPRDSFHILKLALSGSPYMILNSSQSLLRITIRAKSARRVYSLNLVSFGGRGISTWVYLTTNQGLKLANPEALRLAHSIRNLLLKQKVYQPSATFLKPLFPGL